MHAKKAIFAAVFLIFLLSGCATSGKATLPSGGAELKARDISLIECKGSAACFKATVYSVIDGDTINVVENPADEPKSIRFVLVNTPEKTERGYKQAKDFTEKNCPLLSEVIIDEDDGQRGGSYNRMVAKVYCGPGLVNIEEELLENNLAIIYTDFCKKSEFADENWARKYGC